ncbi:unnamed protein product [Fusarium graminearum]|nr:unnamed protein product [Fusarium graminearum]
MCSQPINLVYLVGLCRAVPSRLHAVKWNLASELRADDHGLEQGVGLGLVERRLRWMADGYQVDLVSSARANTSHISKANDAGMSRSGVLIVTCLERIKEVAYLFLVRFNKSGGTSYLMELRETGTMASLLHQDLGECCTIRWLKLLEKH